MEEEKMIVEMKLLFAKGQTNPSACAAIMYYKGFEGRFPDIRKLAEYHYKMYSMEQAAKKREITESNIST